MCYNACVRMDAFQRHGDTMMNDPRQPHRYTLFSIRTQSIKSAGSSDPVILYRIGVVSGGLV